MDFTNILVLLSQLISNEHAVGIAGQLMGTGRGQRLRTGKLMHI